MHSMPLGDKQRYTLYPYLKTLILFFISTPLLAQSIYIPPDHLGEGPSPDILYVDNVGQLRKSDETQASNVHYYCASHTPNVFFETQQVALSWVDDNVLHRLDMIFDCALEDECLSDPVGVQQNAFYWNYYRPGATHTSVSTYDRIVYPDAYPGIDVHYYSNENGYKTVFVVEPTADPTAIRLHFQGQDSLLLDTLNNLRIYKSGKTLALNGSMAYEVDGMGNTTQMSWTPSFTDLGAGKVHFNTGTYNTSNYLVIVVGAPEAPDVTLGAPFNNMEWSTFIGSNSQFLDPPHDRINGIATAEDGSVAVIGSTLATGFPALQSVNLGVEFGFTDGFVLRFNSDNSRSWGALIGGDFNDSGYGIDFDSQNNVFIAVHTNSDTMQVCTDTNQYCQDRTAMLDTFDVYLAKIIPTGNAMTWGTYYSGSDFEFLGPNCLHVNSSGEVIVTGQTKSANMPVLATGNAYDQATRKGGEDVFVAKFSNSGAHLWGSYLGGNGTEDIPSLALGPNNDNIYIHGTTTSFAGNLSCVEPTNGGFPLCINGYSNTDPSNTFVTRFDADGVMASSFFFGGQNGLIGSAVTVDQLGNYYVGGYLSSLQTSSTCLVPLNDEFPICDPGNGAEIDDVFDGGTDCYVAMFTDQNTLQWSTTFGSDELDILTGLACDHDNNLFTVGRTAGDNFPTEIKFAYYNQWGRGNGLDGVQAEEYDAFIAGFDANHTQLWGTYLGGPLQTNQRQEGINAIAIDTSNNIYVGGETNTRFFPVNCEQIGPGYCRSRFTSTDPGDFLGLDGLSEGFLAKFVQEGDGLTSVPQSEKIDENFQVFPNPTGNQLSLPMLAQPTDIKIFTPTGQLLMNQRHQPGVPLDVSGLSSGLYFLRAGQHVTSFVKL